MSPVTRSTPTGDRNFPAGSSSTPLTATRWSLPWSASAPREITRPWTASSPCCTRTSWTAAPGPPARTSGSRSCAGLSGTALGRRSQTALGRLTPVEYDAIMTSPATEAACPNLPPARAADLNHAEYLALFHAANTGLAAVLPADSDTDHYGRTIADISVIRIP